MKAVISLINGLSRLMYWIAGIALAAIVFLTVADVLLRLTTNPIIGTYEIVSLLGAIVIGFAIPQTSIENGQVIMDFLTGKLPPGAAKFFHVLTRILAVFTFFIIGYNLITLGSDLKQTGQVSLTLQIPEYPVAFGIGICCFIECLVLLTQLSFKKGGEI
jgi:TRAP-type C4-dicarboxylate transport system permease small subunit